MLLLAEAQVWIPEQMCPGSDRWSRRTHAHHGLYWLALVKACGELKVQIILGRKLGKHGYFKMSHCWYSWDRHQRWSSCFTGIWVKNWFVFLNKIKIEFCCILHFSLSFVSNLIIWNYIKYINSLLNTKKKALGEGQLIKGFYDKVRAFGFHPGGIWRILISQIHGQISTWKANSWLCVEEDKGRSTIQDGRPHGRSFHSKGSTGPAWLRMWGRNVVRGPGRAEMACTCCP